MQNRTRRNIDHDETTYPVAYQYDDLGRMTAMATTRDSDLAEANLWEAVPNWPLATGNSPLDITRWRYDEATGLLTNKLYADGLGTAYTYTPDGQLATRTWARGSVASYAYDASGSLTNTAYSDATPDISFTYDRLGRQTAATQSGTGGSPVIHSYPYDGLDLVSETQNGVEITRTTDELGRNSGFSMGSEYSVQYGYDTYGRFHSVTSSVFSVPSVANYSYLNNTDLPSGMTTSRGRSPF